MLAKIFSFVFGACLGSFLNVCIYRIPRNLSIVKPSSFCPHCKKPIKWYDNIPILSFIILAGRCRYCRRKISFRYPVVEIITAFLVLFLYSRYGISLEFFKFLFLFSLLVVVSFVDIEFHALPVYLCFLGILTGLVFASFDTLTVLKKNILPLFWQKLPLFISFKGLIFGLGFTYFFKLFGDIFLNFYLNLRGKESIEGERESLGLGDVDFMGMIGTFLGTKCVILTFFIAPFIALFYAIFALILKKSHIIPYLPYLSLATFISFLWGDKILNLLILK